eukprot:688966-Rhodomonas_salina.1
MAEWWLMLSSCRECVSRATDLCACACPGWTRARLQLTRGVWRQMHRQMLQQQMMMLTQQVKTGAMQQQQAQQMLNQVCAHVRSQSFCCRLRRLIGFAVGAVRCVKCDVCFGDADVAGGMLASTDADELPAAAATTHGVPQGVS